MSEVLVVLGGYSMFPKKFNFHCIHYSHKNEKRSKILLKNKQTMCLEIPNHIVWAANLRKFLLCAFRNPKSHLIFGQQTYGSFFCLSLFSMFRMMCVCHFEMTFSQVDFYCSLHDTPQLMFTSARGVWIPSN